jgi:transcription antitermination factor NusG
MACWSVVQTESQRENVAASFLRQAHFEIYLPKILIRNGARERVAPLFPGYLFVEIIDQWWQIRWTVGVLRLLLVDERPARVPERMMDSIRRQEGRDGLVRLPKPRGLCRGDPVQVVRGTFEGKLGVYQGLSGADRSKILLSLLGRQVPVWLPTVDVKQLAASCAA